MGSKYKGHIRQFLCDIVFERSLANPYAACMYIEAKLEMQELIDDSNGCVRCTWMGAEVIFLWMIPSARGPVRVVLKVKFDGEGWFWKATVHSYLLL